MSTWRHKAIETFPDLRHEFEDPDTTIYQVFFELLPRVQNAHARGDTQELQRIYDFAHWCLHQNADDLWNAAGVAFYEHLVDDPTTRSQIPRWLHPVARIAWLSVGGWKFVGVWCLDFGVSLVLGGWRLVLLLIRG